MATKADLETILKAEGVEIPADATKPVLEKMVEDLNKDAGDQNDGEKSNGDTPKPKKENKSNTPKIKESKEHGDTRKKILAKGMITTRFGKQKGVNEVSATINGVRFVFPTGEQVEVPKVVAELIFNKLDAQEGTVTNAEGEDLRDKALDADELN